MNIPNLDRIVEAHVPVADTDAVAYLQQLRLDVLPYIRKLQSDGHIRWFSFLLHSAKQLSGGKPGDSTLVIHLRIEMASDDDLAASAKLLPSHFLTPTKVELSDISGVDRSELLGHEWAHAWWLVGEASEFVLSLLESYENPPSPQRVIQYLHFITNGFGMGMTCQYAPSRIPF
jgi:hypothetical protein